jgi:TRAP-type C4-dicarboxylate transport system permease small subunit
MKTLTLICRWLNIGAYGATGIIMTLTVADVLLRLILRHPIQGVTEITEYLMLFLCLAMAYTAIEHQHISVGVILQRLPPKGKAIIEIIEQIIGLGVVFILTWKTFEAGLYANQYKVTSSSLELPDFPFYMVLVASFAILGISILFLIIRNVEVLKK